MGIVPSSNESRTPARLFDDDTMAQFIERGFVSFEPELPGDLHEFIHRQTVAALASGNPGNNILPVVPELQTIFDEPRVRGALSSILGPDYAMHPHRHCHVNAMGSDGQRLHKDAFSVRYHRIHEALAFYYPHDVDVEMGATAVVPGSQYHGKQLDAEMPPEVPVCGKAGTVTIAHYDLWHRGTPNRASADRYMIKFLFTRMSQPRRPSWDSSGEAWPRDDSTWTDLHSTVWDWHRGNPNASKLDSGDDPAALLEKLGDENESTRLRAAYRLGRLDEAVVGPLADRLKSADEEVRHAAGYALSALGPAATEAVVAAVENSPPLERTIAIEVLGNIGESAATAVPLLSRILSTGSSSERGNAADTLGKMNGSAMLALPALLSALRDEEENVRGSAVLALARLAPDEAEAVRSLQGALKDTSWYVRGGALEALERIGSAEAQQVLMQHMRPARWCPVAARS
jgi:hypothetical protein